MNNEFWNMRWLDPQIAAAVFGAAAAFVLMRFGEWLTAWYHRAARNYEELLRLEVVYRQYLIDVSGMRVRIAAVLKSNQPDAAVIMELPGLPEQPLLSSEIQSLDLINALATHWTRVRKLNADIASLANARTLLQSAIEASTDSRIASLFTPYLTTLRKIDPFLAELESKTQEVIACILVLTQTSRPLFFKLFDRCHPRWAKNRFRAKVEKELAALRMELDQCGEKRRAEIQDVAKNN